MRGLHRDPSWTTRHASARTGPVGPAVERATGLASEAATVRTATPRWFSELADRAVRSETADVDHAIVEELASKPLTGDESVDYWINSAQVSKSDGTDYDIVQALSRLAGRRTAATAQLTTGATHRVSGWDWDHRLSGFVARAGTAHFACPCGTTLATPGFTSCHCGKVWNAYEITSGTERKLIAREIPRRDVVLSRRLP